MAVEPAVLPEQMERTFARPVARARSAVCPLALGLVGVTQGSGGARVAVAVAGGNAVVAVTVGVLVPA